ncbi:ComEC/Rec2 family competence protein, partial [Streptomyces cacaoi]|uniref:ComEC/Rec2 family competence protein n=1 Tax=Streptomyces cacaoi TaxID=1898 RepID=UPI003748F837
RAEPPGQAAFVRRTAGQAGVPLVPAAVGERRRAGDLSWQVLWPPSPAEPSAPGTEGTASGETPGDGETSGGAVGDAAVRDGAVHAGAPSDGSVAQGEEGGGANDASITLLVRTGGLTLFLPGDLEPEAQQGLLALWPGLKRVDVLKVAHHGSRYQDGELQRRLHPRIAFVSAGSDNPYGHPAPETVHRLQASGALVARTDRHGALALVARPHAAPTVVTERGSPRGGADDGPAGPPAPPGAARPERAGRRGGRWFRRGGRTAQARGAGDGNGGGGRS